MSTEWRRLIIKKYGSYLLVAVMMLGLLAGMGTSAEAEDLNVATINMQEVLMAHPAIQEAQQELQEKQMEMMADLEEMDEEDAAAQQQQMQQELQMLQQDLLESAIAEVENDIAEIAADLGYNVVLNQQGIVSGEEALEAVDITDEVMEEFNGEVEMDPQF